MTSALEQGLHTENIDVYDAIKDYVKDNVDVDTINDEDLQAIMKRGEEDQNKIEMLVDSLGKYEVTTSIISTLSYLLV